MAAQNYPKLSEMVKNGLKLSKVVKNGGPDVKRARRTGLKGGKDEVTRPEGPLARSWAPEEPLNY